MDATEDDDARMSAFTNVVTMDALKTISNASMKENAPQVQVGDTVKVGDVVGSAAEGKLSMPVHASIAGKVAEVTDKYVVIRA